MNAGQRRLAAAAAAAALLVVLALLVRGASKPPLPGRVDVRPEPGLVVGVIANALDGGAARTADRVRAVGVRWLREELPRADIEPVRGRYELARTDELLVELARRGIRVLPVLYGTPAWAGPERDALPRDLGAWRGYVAAVTRRYGPGGTLWREHPELDARLAPTTWEVWNEPYFPQFSGGDPDPARYARLVAATARAAAPGVELLAALELTYARRDGTTGNWTRELLAAVPSLDGMVGAYAVHPYSAGPPRDDSPPPAERFRRFVGIERELTAGTGGPRPLWFTEIGWSTCTARPPCVSRLRQARYLADAYHLVATTYRAWVRAFFVYRFDDGAGDPADPQNAYGVLGAGARPKPALEVLRRAAG